MTAPAAQVFRWRRSPAMLLVGASAHGGAMAAIAWSQAPFRIPLYVALALSALLFVRHWLNSAGVLLRDACGDYRWAPGGGPEASALPVRITRALRWPLLLLVDLVVEAPGSVRRTRALVIPADALGGDDLRRLSAQLRCARERSGVRG